LVVHPANGPFPASIERFWALVGKEVYYSNLGFRLAVTEGFIGSHNPPVVSLVAATDDYAPGGQYIFLQLTFAVEVVVALEDGVGLANGCS
jgi:hypothetical protein